MRFLKYSSKRQNTWLIIVGVWLDTQREWVRIIIIFLQEFRFSIIKVDGYLSRKSDFED